MRLADRKKPGTVTITGNVGEGLTQILEGSGWVPHWVSSDATEYTMELTDSNVLEMIWQWAKVTGTEPSFNSGERKWVSLVTGGVGQDRGYSFRYGKNLKTIHRTVLPPKATRLYAYGKNDLDISSLASGLPYIEDYSWYTASGMTLAQAKEDYRKDEQIVDTTFIEAGPLYDMAARTLAVWAQPTITYEARVIDLSTLVGHDEATFVIGDTVWVEGEPISVSERARVTRIKRYPYEPDRDEIELTFGEVTIPDANQSNARSDTTQSWELFATRTTGIRKVRVGTTILNRIRIRATADAQAVINYTVEGVGVGSGTLNLQAIDDETGEALWPTQTFTITNGAKFNWQFSIGETEIAQGNHTYAIRAWSSGSSVGIDIPDTQSAFWILIHGATRENVVLPNSIRFDYTGAVQYFTVPDDVTEILIEAHGASGGGTAYGGMVRAMFASTPGSILDVIVGQQGQGGGSPGWPNGGAGNGPFASQNGGGGSSDVRPHTASFVSAMIVAGAGGGPGEGYGGFTPSGGIGGFYQGGNGVAGAAGATQYAGGAGLSPGADGAFNQGGAAAGTGNFFHFGGGGGGGGWYGGEGGMWTSLGSNSGGGGGSGMVDATAWDLEYTDGENNGHGYVIISWETPDEP